MRGEKTRMTGNKIVYYFCILTTLMQNLYVEHTALKKMMHNLYDELLKILPVGKLRIKLDFLFKNQIHNGTEHTGKNFMS